MKIKVGDALVYNDTQVAMRYGTGVVTSITPEECVILWSARGLTRYRRAILDEKMGDIFQRVDKRADTPKERHLHLGASKAGISFNENYDRAKLEQMCGSLKETGARKAKDVAEGLMEKLFTRKLALRGGARTVLMNLAELCNARGSASEEARNISRELFFGYVIQKSDFKELEVK
ncbi:MAG TPA: hypothetical protein VE262_24710 [Blastocatellia bacterium]|nr:hypothetical protein [Blastocatellia bacterium]